MRATVDHWVRLNQHFRSDLQWWAIFLEDWNGVALFGGVVRRPPKFTLTSDASDHWGCGAFTSSGNWFQFQWPPVWADVHITVKELPPPNCGSLCSVGCPVAGIYRALSL